MKKILTLTLLCFLVLVSKGFSQYSTDPNKLTPIKGTSWSFTYTIDSTSYNDTLNFGDEVDTSILEDGTAVLVVLNQYIEMGLAVYADDLPPLGAGFLTRMYGTPINMNYFFNVSGNNATGFYFTTDSSTLEPTSEFYPMTGVKSTGCLAEILLKNDEESLNILRNFRDKVLAKSDKGRELIKLYYEKSPQIIELIEKNPLLKKQCRAILKAIMPAFK